MPQAKESIMKARLLLIGLIAFSLCCKQTTQSPTRPGQVPTNASGDLFLFSQNGKDGFVDVAGKIVIEPKFDGAGRFSEGLAPFRSGILWGYINQLGEIVIPAEFDWASSFSEGLGCVEFNGRWGYIDKSGKFAISPQFSHADSFSEGLAAVLTDVEEVYIDRTGRVVLDLGDWFKGGGQFSEGLAPFSDQSEKFGYIDKSGRIFIPAHFQRAESFGEGLAAVMLGDKWGYIDNTGRMIIAPQFKSASVFSEGLARVESGDWLSFLNHRLGYIDKLGHWVIPARFDGASDFSDGVAAVVADGKEGLINRAGDYVWRQKP